jgi:hypothetical protein
LVALTKQVLVGTDLDENAMRHERLEDGRRHLPEQRIGGRQFEELQVLGFTAHCVFRTSRCRSCVWRRKLDPRDVHNFDLVHNLHENREDSNLECAGQTRRVARAFFSNFNVAIFRV